MHLLYNIEILFSRVMIDSNSNASSKFRSIMCIIMIETIFT